MRRARPVVAVDLGGTNIRAAVVTDGRVTDLAVSATPAREGAAAVVEAVVSAVHHVASGDVTGVGIASAGLVDPVEGRIVAATDLIAGWAGTPLASLVSQAVGLPVRACNDVHGHALGEARYGAGRSVSSLLLVAAGTGLGGAYVVDGRLVTGFNHLAGHLGHVPCSQAAGVRCSCGATGHLESVASGSGLERMYRATTPAGPGLAARDVARAAARGDVAAATCLVSAGEALGEAVGGWCNLLDPEVVVVTGGLAQAGPAWWSALRAAHQRHVLPGARHTPIVGARHPHDAALLGAASLFTRPIQPSGARR